MEERSDEGHAEGDWDYRTRAADCADDDRSFGDDHSVGRSGLPGQGEQTENGWPKVLVDPVTEIDWVGS